MIPRVDPPREARLLICQAESDASAEYGDRMDALEAEERLSRHYDHLPPFIAARCTSSVPPRDEASQAFPVPVAGPARPPLRASAHLLDAKQAA